MRNIQYKERQKRRKNYPSQIGIYLMFFVCSLFSKAAIAQNYLSSLITINAREQKLGEVLERISSIGGFYFSYSSSAIPKDSLVNVSVNQESVEKILNQLLKGDYEYKEAPNYIILRLAPNRLQLVSEENQDFNEIQNISGYVIDDQTGKRIPNASVYEKRLLISTLTDQDGYFNLKFKHSVKSISLTISKEYYRDTTVVLLAPVLVTSDPGKNYSYGYRPKDERLDVERTAIARFLVSSKQKLQSLNLGGFFASAPVQTSIIPGVSTHGSLSGQVINKFSLNILGGYTSGVKGVELGGIFNINKREMNAMQVAGVFNLVGERVNGLQMAGGVNTVLDSVKGFQIAGLYNYNEGSFKGFQMAGGLNIVKKAVKGVQLAGIGNSSKTETRGLQMAGLFNYTKNLKGLQIGLVNLADSSSGTSIGLLNFIGKGYRKVSISNNEVTALNVEYKSGNENLYTILKVGTTINPDEKVWAFGVGFGHDFIFNQRIAISAELLSQNIYLGNWKELSNLYRTIATFNYRLSNRFALFAGPTFNLFVDDRTEVVAGYKNTFPFNNYPGKQFSSSTNGWIGWDVGITLF